ncbi:MlaD family protein [Formicincola oecophyllae]|uniref:MlaD family protein n=1 Tax=Formicincola oecophyllae TaxID=2558361 RepID=UPI001F102333|nr:MlaD family protein [Formicincola oecophyllae]
MREGTGGGVASYLASAAVLVFTGAFVVYALTLRTGPGGPQTPYKAVFFSANGLDSGDNVILDGVVVGRVDSITLDRANDVANVDFTVNSGLKLPSDTAVTIAAPSPTADNALALLPGKAKTILKPGTTITDARPLLSLEQQISNFIFGGGKL